jgi:hypothetical protein
MPKEIFCKECDDHHYEGQLCHTQKDVWEKYNSSLTLAELKKLLPKSIHKFESK